MYIQLYTKTVYSLLKSALKIDDYVKMAKEFNMKSLAITDENNVYGLIKFYKECTKHNIKPILGITISLETNTPLILLAKNNDGYRNILKISSIIQISENKNIKLEMIKEYANDLFCIIPTINTTIENLLLNNQLDFLTKLFKELKNIFFNGLYISIFHDDKINEKLIYLGKQLDINFVTINEVKYLNKEDSLTLKYLEAINRGEKISSNSINLFNNDNTFLNQENYLTLFQNYPEYINNSVKIANQCNVTINFDKPHLPKYQTPKKVSSAEYLKILCKKGLEKRLNTTNIPLNYLNRLKYELNVIISMNFSDYFLIVFDFVKYAKRNNIYVGPGRGSAAGSLVSYVLGITNVNPIEYNLLFERFLNPERITMPDIDLDFQDDRRDEVISYVQKKYGNHNVAHIVAFGTFQARSAIREIAKVMEISEIRINEIISYINPSLSIEDNINNSNELKIIINSYKEINRLLNIAKKVEGIPRNTTTHAAGIIICEENLTTLTGLQPSLDAILQTQYEAKDLEDLGLLKIDFLGLRNLTTISEIIKLIKNNNKKLIDIDNIPLNDDKTYRLIARGETTGLFQLESDGMRNVLKDIKASQFEDIVAVNALYRPGPMDNIPLYIKRRQNNERIEYLHEDLEPILASTYGIIVYQEQIMQIAKKIANYSLGKADILRRAVSKKLKDVLEKEREVFILNAIKNGYRKEIAQKLYDYIIKFGDYGFNRSHSVSYALISYQMAYLKANYITAFMVVLLSSVIGSEYQTNKYIRDCKRYGIQILPISINKSYNNYIIENNNSIRLSILTIKGIGKNNSDALLEQRDKGRFKDFFDFINRCKDFLRQNIFESLVFVGALDEFNLSKRAMIENYDKVIDLSRFNQSGYFTDKIEYQNETIEYSTSELMKNEKKALGFYLTTHPIRKFINDKNNINYIIPSKTIKYIDKIIDCIGFVENIRKIKTKLNEEMALLVISDDVSSIDAVIFPSNYLKLKNNIDKNKLYQFRGKVQERNQKIQLVIYNIQDIK